MTSPKIVFLDASTMDGGKFTLEPLQRLGELSLFPTSSPAEASSRVAGVDIILTNTVVVGPEVMDAAGPSLRLVVVCATGVNNIDLDAARERGITVCNVSGYSTASVAQHAIALLLNLATNAHRYAADAPALWPQSPIFTRLDHPAVEFNGKLFGVAGLGSIGKATASIASALGMQIQALARDGAAPAAGNIPRVPRDEFFATSDVVSLHCPLTGETKHMVNATTLALMKPSAFLVNTSRGPLVDEPALAAALRSNAIAGAALDVLSVEPPPADHPLLAPDIPNLFLTPHTAWMPDESRVRLIDGVAANIQAFIAGSPINVVP